MATEIYQVAMYPGISIIYLHKVIDYAVKHSYIKENILLIKLKLTISRL